MEMEDCNNRAYVTLLSTDAYLMGVLLLNLMLKRVHSRYPLLVLCSDSLSKETLDILKKMHITYRLLREHISIEGVIQTDSNQAHWSSTFDKLYIWTLTEFNKIVYIDSDMQILTNIDDLFEFPHLSAVKADVFNNPNVKGFNSGLMVICPNLTEFNGLKALWMSGKLGKSSIGDQDVINEFYANRHIQGGAAIRI